MPDEEFPERMKTFREHVKLLSGRDLRELATKLRFRTDEYMEEFAAVQEQLAQNNSRGLAEQA